MSYSTLLVEERSPDGGTHWFAVHPDLVGCHAIGRDQDDALRALEEAGASWLRVARERGARVPPEGDLESVTVVYLPDPEKSVGLAGKDPVREVRIPAQA